MDLSVLSICNPLTRMWRDLLPMPHPHTSTCFVKMVANRKLNSYKVIRVGQVQPLPPVRNNGSRLGLCTEVYDSVEGSWRCIYNTLPMSASFKGALCARIHSTVGLPPPEECWRTASSKALGLSFFSQLDSILDAKMVDGEGKPFLVTRVWKVALWRPLPSGVRNNKP